MADTDQRLWAALCEFIPTVRPLPPIAQTNKRKQGKEKESACLLLGDLHYGAKTESFDMVQASIRVQWSFLKAAHILDILQPSYSIDHLIVCLLGDIVTGEHIYPGQSWEIDAPLSTQVMRAAEDLAQNIAWISQWVRHVTVHVTPGNHGRVSAGAAAYHRATNFDSIAYAIMKQLLRKQKRVDLQVPELPINPNDQLPWYAMFTERGHRFFMTHGSTIRMYQKIPRYGIDDAITHWGQILGPFDVAMLGHFHTGESYDISGIRTFLNGTIVSHDTFSVEVLKRQSDPCQWFFGVCDSYPVTWQFPLTFGNRASR